MGIRKAPENTQMKKKSTSGIINPLAPFPTSSRIHETRLLIPIKELKKSLEKENHLNRKDQQPQIFESPIKQPGSPLTVPRNTWLSVSVYCLPVKYK